MILGVTPWAPPHAYANRRWGNPARTQHNTVLRQRVVLMMFLAGGGMHCGKAGVFGLVHGTLTHLQGEQVRWLRFWQIEKWMWYVFKR